MKPLQIVVCVGPRCSARGNPERLLSHLEALRAQQPDPPLYAATYDCLSRCPAGPNLVVRELPLGSPEPDQPGLLQLSGAQCYFGVYRGLLDRIVEAHRQGHGPLPGRCTPY